MSREESIADKKESLKHSVGKLAIYYTFAVFIIAFSLGYSLGGAIFGFDLLAYAIILDLISMLAVIPFFGILLFYFFAARIPHYIPNFMSVFFGSAAPPAVAAAFSSYVSLIFMLTAIEVWLVGVFISLWVIAYIVKSVASH